MSTDAVNSSWITGTVISKSSSLRFLLLLCIDLASLEVVLFFFTFLKHRQAVFSVLISGLTDLARIWKRNYAFPNSSWEHSVRTRPLWLCAKYANCVETLRRMEMWTSNGRVGGRFLQTWDGLWLDVCKFKSQITWNQKHIRCLRKQRNSSTLGSKH